jgi:DNA polymerase-3 subunit gamma/tau
VVTALYRRYRPENFAELIGQSQVTDPLRTALRTNRVNHAYLFSGPRGCGKTTSARILARCLNCAEGPTDTPCGVCPSCLELARDGSGSLDVIEIDAASHNGVDDARDLRDRAIFAPARDRYKIFILDEAHMVTPQGFNALLKLVEEPPEHVKFIFATTEPEKVIGTIRSRTHHYPFRLVPPAVMLEYVEQLCTQESVTVAPGVLPLVVRAGGGSVRDTLSLLDQLMAGSEDRAIAYDRAVALLGYTDGALLDDVVDALAVADPAAVFSAVDRVVQTGQDPRRFVEDLLERLRDLIIVAATHESAGAVLRGVSPEELSTMTRQAAVFGAVGLSRSADIANTALTEMTGATSPRLHLELMVARMLVPEADDTTRGALSRVERLERRIGVGDAGGHSAAPLDAPVGRAASAIPEPVAADPAVSASASWAAAGPASSVTESPTGLEARPAPVTQPTAATQPATTEPAPAATEPAPAATAPAPAASGSAPSAPVGAVGVQQMRDSWPQIVEHVQRARRSAWTVVVTAQVTAFVDDVLTLTFPSQQDVAKFKEMGDPADSISQYVRTAILEILGVRVKFVARGPAAGGGSNGTGTNAPAASGPGAGSAPAASASRPAAQALAVERPAAQAAERPAAQAPDRPSTPTPEPASSGPVTDWVVAAIPTEDPAAGAVADEVEPAWAAPFGSVAPDATSAPVPPSTRAPAAEVPAGASTDPTPSSPAPSSPAPSSPAPSSPAPSNPSVSASPASAQSPSATSVPAPPAPDVPVDDYPLDDEPYDDGAPFPDPGFGGRQPVAPQNQQPQQQRSAPAPSAAPSSPPRTPATPAAGTSERPGNTGPRRAAVPGRYGEAVVREILGAQFIEETALDDGRGGF